MSASHWVNSEPALLGAVGPPDRLNLVAAEHRRQLGAVFGGHPRERHGQVVTESELGEVRRLDPVAGERPRKPFAPVEHAVDEPVPLLAVLAEQRREPLHRRGLERHEAVRPEAGLDPADRLPPPQRRRRQVVPHPADRLRGNAAHGSPGGYARE